MGTQVIRGLLLVASLAICVVAAAEPAVAVPDRQAGITVSPAIAQIKLGKSQTTAAFPVTLTNNTAESVVIDLSVRDFTSYGENGQVSFMSQNQSDAHGLAKSLTFSPTQLVLAAGQHRMIVVSIANAGSLSPGGHYGVLLYKAVSVTNGHGNSVGITQAVSTLVFATTYGGDTQSLQFEAVDVGRAVTAMPTAVNVVLANSGNTQSTPRGYAQIIGHGNKVVAQGILNVDSSMILPGGKRLFSVVLTKTGRAWPGAYHVRVYYRYDGQQGFVIFRKAFLFINVTLILAMIVALALIALAVRWLLPRALTNTGRRKYKLRH